MGVSPSVPTLVSMMFLAISLVACTPGAFGAPSARETVATRVVAIDVDLTRDPGGATFAGTGGGYAPLSTELAVGDGVRFTNSDGFAHTATSIAGARFPSAYPFTSSALTAQGSTLSGGFSSGSLAAGTSSQTIVADRAGAFVYGCFYHYGSPMRAAIVVR